MKKNSLKEELEHIAQRGIPDDTNLWPQIAAQLERSPSMMYLRFRPFWVILIVVLALITVSGAAYAVGRTLGYIPGIGMVDNSAGIRRLAEPVTVTREGVTLTVSHVVVYPEHVELIYEVEGIAPEDDDTQSGDANARPADFCGGVEIGSSPNPEGNARLQLPDGTILERDTSGKYAQNVFAMKPVYTAAVPADVNRMTFLLECIPHARRGAVPERWSVAFDLKAVPAGMVIGAPVVEVEPNIIQPVTELTPPAASPTATITPAAHVVATQAAVIPVREVTMSLTKVVPLDTATVFYFAMDMENKDPSLISIMPAPASVYVVDSQGQKIPLRGNFTWQPFEHRVGSEFEFASQTKPADGPLTLVVENAIAYYAPMYVEPQQATPEEMTFTFDAGPAPQYGQTWEINREFFIAGYPIRVTSARAANFDDIATPDYIDGSQGYDYGYDFGVETDPAVKMLVEMDIMSEDPPCWLSNSAAWLPDSSSLHYVQLCRERYPSGNVRVTIRELSVLVENTWQTVWEP